MLVGTSGTKSACWYKQDLKCLGPSRIFTLKVCVALKVLVGQASLNVLGLIRISFLKVLVVTSRAKVLGVSRMFASRVLLQTGVGLGSVLYKQKVHH